jgi:hypothetical protein
MRIQLKTVLDCEPDVAWRALRSPAALREIYGPLLDMRPESALPTMWNATTATVALSVAGLVPTGRQRIDISFEEQRADGVRILIDDGAPLSGPLALLSSWRHRMAVAPAPDDHGKTLYRDRLDIGGPAAPVLWFPLWTVWQWRGSRLAELAPTWAYDPEIVTDDEEGTKTEGGTGGASVSTPPAPAEGV